MIESFKDRRLKRFFERGENKHVRADLVDRIRTILGRLNVAMNVEDMDLHSYRLHTLKGDLKGFYSVTVRANWRIIFRFESGNAYDVELIDYH